MLNIMLIIYRIKLFQNTEDDKFLPHYKFDCTLPEIPVKPKLFHYKIDYKKACDYEYSSVEINQEQPINVDYDMGMAIDLIDRDIYNLEPTVNRGEPQPSA
jgi:Paf1